MARAGYGDVVADSFGNRLAGASVEVRQTGTATKVVGALYAGPTGAATLGNPFVANSLGYFAFYRDAAETVDLYVAAPGYGALTVSGVAVAVDAPVVDGAQLVAGSVTTMQLADGTVGTADLADGAVTAGKIADGTITDVDVAAANKDGTAATPSLRTLGTGAQQAAAGNHGHSHASLSGIGANDHHAQAHALSGGDHTGTLALSQLPMVPAARVTGSSQTVSNATNTALAYTAESYDTDAMHDNATNNSRLTINTAGKYLLSGGADWGTDTTAGRRFCGLLVNGSTFVKYVESGPPSGSGNLRQEVTDTYQLTAGDYVQVVVLQSTGGTLNVTPQAFSATWLSA